MRCLNCGVCCQETQMLLSKDDIKRLVKKGYNKKFFLRYDKKGYAQLRNLKGFCVFYDTEKKQCVVYNDKPLGCSVYPVILDVDVGVIIDSICSSKDSISEQEMSDKGKIVIELLKQIDRETQERLR
jgi:uncharacterized protein